MGKVPNVDIKNLLATIEEEKARNMAMLLSIGEGLIVTDTKGKILLVNKAFEEMIGWKSYEVKKRSLRDVLVVQNEKGKKVPFCQRAFPRVMQRSTKVISENHYLLRRDKTRFPVVVTATPIILNKKIIGVIEVIRDVTHEKEIDKAKSEFVSFVSHQLRTPLSTINWYAELLLDNQAGKISSDQRTMVKEIYENNKRMIELINDLLNVSRIELGTILNEPESVTLRKLKKLVRGVLNELTFRIRAKNLKISIKFDRGLRMFRVDPRLLRIILVNLLSNATKYTAKHGKIFIQVSKEKTYILFMVADTGLGIPANAKPKIYSKLFRAENVRKRESEGTGLGLYIVKSIIAKLGGKIWFESEENIGTFFYFTIPILKKRK